MFMGIYLYVLCSLYKKKRRKKKTHNRISIAETVNAEVIQ